MKLLVENVNRKQNKHPIEILSEDYPQLNLTIYKGASDSLLYRNIVQKGHQYIFKDQIFTLCPEDDLFTLASSYGKVLVIYLSIRQDFENIVRILRYRCEPEIIPKSMGAVMISGITNWRKIEKHKNEYLSQGKEDWLLEFKRFTSEKKNYQEQIIVISRGGYSGINYYDTNYSLEKWEDVSKDIRIYHEYTHYLCRNMFLKNSDIIWEEIIADCMGILYATGEYDVRLAKKFLGIDQERYTPGGRIENYLLSNQDLNNIAKAANKMIELLAEKLRNMDLEVSDYFEVLKTLYALKEGA